MTTVGATTGTTPATSQSAAASKSLTQTYDTFLTLLTTQLKNQDPLSPMDSTKFTEQLVQYSGVEQSINQNKNLETMISLLQGNQASNAIGYIGRNVQANSADAASTGSGASWNYSLASNAAATSVQVLDSTGRVVRSTTGETSAGSHSFAWDGTDDQGNTAAPGTYTLSVSAADSAKAPVTATISVGGLVTGVENGTSGPMLIIGGARVPASSVTTVQQAA